MKNYSPRAALALAYGLAAAGCAPAYLGRYQETHGHAWPPPAELQSRVRPALTEPQLLAMLGRPLSRRTSVVGEQTLHHLEFCTHLRTFDTGEGEASYAWFEGNGRWSPVLGGYHCGGYAGEGGAFALGRVVRVVTSNGAVSQVYF